VSILDVTDVARTVHARLRNGDETGATAVLPRERPYPLPPDIATVINASPDEPGS
jgi:hypothetical protein